MTGRPVTFIGFGEAAQAFADGLVAARAFDRKTDAEHTRAAKLADYARLGVAGCGSAGEAITGAALVLSLVTADQALAAARGAARSIEAGALFCDMNSVAPDTKRAAAAAIEAAGGRYVDVAVMAPVHPQRRAVPLLVSGPHAEDAATILHDLGFTKLRVLAGTVGAASSVKMLRSVMIKGLEALTAECVLAADEAGVLGEVIASLDASWPGADWAARADYNLERMMVHGLRRAEEMEEVVKTLDALGTGAAMSRGTVARQRAIGGRLLDGHGSLVEKIAALRAPAAREAA